MGIYQITPKIKYYIDDKTAHNLYEKKKLVTKKDRDLVFVVSGGEGTGKSTLAMQFAKFMDPTFHTGRIAFNVASLTELIANAKKGQTILFDEAFVGLAAKSSLHRENRKLIELIMEMRQKNLILFIVLPSLWSLDKYILLERSVAVFHTYLVRDRRGRYAVFSKSQLQILEHKGRRLRNMNCITPRHRTRFSGRFPLDNDGENKVETEYRAFKLAALKKKMSDPSEMDRRRIKAAKIRDYLLHRLIGKEKIALSKIVDELREIGYPMGSKEVFMGIRNGERMAMAIDITPRNM